MSFRGITFKNQEVRPEDDGRLYAAILTDGVIHGCAFSSAGYTLTVTAGLLIACGRLIKIPSPQNYPMDGDSEGYARLLLRINLTGEATNTAFQQAEAVVEYSTSLGGFAEVLQPDINDGSSVLYELPLAVCQLSASGISSIVETLQQAEFREEEV